MPRPSRRTPPGCTDRGDRPCGTRQRGPGVLPRVSISRAGLDLVLGQPSHACCSPSSSSESWKSMSFKVVASLCKHCSVATFQRERALESMTRSDLRPRGRRAGMTVRASRSTRRHGPARRLDRQRDIASGRARSPPKWSTAASAIYSKESSDSSMRTCANDSDSSRTHRSWVRPSPSRAPLLVATASRPKPGRRLPTALESTNSARLANRTASSQDHS